MTKIKAPKLPNLMPQLSTRRRANTNDDTSTSIPSNDQNMKSSASFDQVSPRRGESSSDVTKPPSPRGRSNTAPPSAMDGLMHPSLPSPTQEEEEEEQKQPPPPVDAYAPAPGTTIYPPPVLSTAPPIPSPSSGAGEDSITRTSSVESEGDEEIRQAKAMAMAIQSNPHMTVEEVQKLVVQQQQQRQQAASASSTTTTTKGPHIMGARLSNLFQPNASPAAAAAVAGDGGGGEDQQQQPHSGKSSKRAFRFDGSRLQYAARGVQSSARGIFPKHNQGGGEGQSPKATTSAAADPNLLGPIGEVLQKVPAPQDVVQVATGKVLGVQAKTMEVMAKMDGQGTLVNAVGGAGTNVTAKTVTFVGNVGTDAAAKVATVATTTGTNTAAAMISALSSFTGPTNAESGDEEIMAAPTTPASQPDTATIRLTAIAWKRRGGMGKYSTTGAWERRRIELQGSRIMYYEEQQQQPNPEALEVAESGMMNMPPTPAPAPLGIHASVPAVMSSMPFNSALAAPSSEDASEGVVVARRTTWFEQAYSKVTEVAQGAAAAAGLDETAPRGVLDIAKEKATVHAAFGHSGSPSPFAISIKVRGETKWKFCFDQHRAQMEWLTALTDVVVQSSLDVYNAQLLENADPSHQADGIFNQSVHEPPCSGGVSSGNKGHALWTMDPYKLVSSDPDAAFGDDDDDEELEFGSSHPLSDDYDEGAEVATVTRDLLAVAGADVQEEDAAAQSAATETVAKTWSLPEKHLTYAAGVLNAALAVARASSTTMEGFWFLVALANVGMFLCLVEEPDWRGLLPYIRAEGANTSPKKTKAKGGMKKAKTTTAKKSAEIEPTVPGYKPIAGITSVKLNQPTDPPVNADGELFAGWRCPPGDTILVRSHGYLSTKAKVPSPGELYECTQLEVFESPHRYPDMASRVVLPKVEFKDDGPKTWRSPDVFIVSVALPTDPPKLGRSSSDGGGYTLTIYFTMKQETRDILRRVTADGYVPSQEDERGDAQKNKVNAVRLLEEWCRRAPNDPKWFSRFKVVPNAHNLKEIGMPSWIAKYNGKPFLIKRPGVTGFIYQHPELSCLEFDVSLHPFPYLAKQAICFMKETFFKKILCTFGFVIEGRADDELPECVIGCMQMCYPDPAHAIMAKDFFAGTCHQSF